MKAILLSLLSFLAASLALHAQDDFDFLQGANPSVFADDDQGGFLSEVSSIAPGEPFPVALTITHDPGWHSYYVNTGLIGKTFKAKWTLPDGFTVKRVGWPTPHLAAFDAYQTIGYEDNLSHLFEITPPTNLNTGSTVNFSVKASWQVCDESRCSDKSFSSALELKVSDSSILDPNNKEAFEEARAHYPQSAEDFTITAHESNNIITLKVVPAPDLKTADLHFFDEAGQISVQEAHKASIENGELLLKLPRNLGNSFSGAGPILDTLTGILSDGTSSYFLETLLTGTQEPSQATGNASSAGHSTAEPTESELAEMAKLYDPSKKINFVPFNEAAETTFWTALIFSFIGGTLLNLMPCVFPVLGLKVMGFVEQAGNEARKIKLHGLAFTAGLVASMWVLAGFILFFKISMGRDINWGQQMGNPYFVGTIILVLFILGLNMAGVFEMGTSLTSAGQKVKKKGYSGSFFSGVLTTLIATPCSGPFLGAAMGYTLAQPAAIALFLFTIFALGISSPYLLLSFFPALINKLPKPGAWMETFKITMSFALFATVAFFMKTFGAQTGADGLALLVMALVVIGLALFFYGHWSLPYRKPKVRIFAGMVLPSVIGIAGLYLVFQASSKHSVGESAGEGWVAWQPGKVEHSRAKKRIVWVDYTADW